MVIDVATNFGRQFHDPGYVVPPNSVSPIVLGDPKYGTIGLDFLVGTVAFGNRCVVTDGWKRPFLSFVAGNGSVGVAGLTGRVSVRNPHHIAACDAALPGEGLQPWGAGNGLLDLSLEVDCARDSLEEPPVAR